MSKRILLVLALGMSVAPSVFAAGTGQQGIHATPEAGVRCGTEYKDKNLSAAPVASSSSGDVQAYGAEKR